MEQGEQRGRAGRRDFGRLPQYGIARGQRLRHLRAVEKEGVVPCADDADDAARPAMNDIALFLEP